MADKEDMVLVYEATGIEVSKESEVVTIPTLRFVYDLLVDEDFGVFFPTFEMLLTHLDRLGLKKNSDLRDFLQVMIEKALDVCPSDEDNLLTEVDPDVYEKAVRAGGKVLEDK